MPYSAHPDFQGIDENEHLFRYMSTAKFISILSKSALYFPSLGALSSCDPFEGALGNANYEMLNLKWSDLTEEHKKSINIFEEEQYNLIRMHRIMTLECSQTMTMESIFVNCWHSSLSESDAMWKLYSFGGEGVAILSDFQCLVKAFEKTQKEVYIGKVNYVDHRSHVVDTSNCFNSALWKRREFSHEREVRIAVMDFSNLVDGRYDYVVDGKAVAINSVTVKDCANRGLHIDVDLNALVKKIIINPNSPDWYKDAISNLINKFGYAWEVGYSDLRDRPVSNLDFRRSHGIE